MKNKLGTRILQVLNEKGMTQRELADAVHLNPNTINSYIRNRRIPDCEIVSRIAAHLGTNVDYLLGNTNLRSYPQLGLSEREGLLLSNYRAMDDEHRKILEAMSAILHGYCFLDSRRLSSHLSDTEKNPDLPNI